ncbi:hypothetical protein HHI36_004247 [Cryptolaemus montrouzieri]|uniref:Zinc finger PHD-type domain-containing protein n=1 Tax=Cryptolaemus montrouzieri TaxID=559131 RepID=A0ABD2NQM7_9CUCU
MKKRISYQRQKIRNTKKNNKTKQQKEKSKSNNSPINSDDEKEIHFATDSVPDAVIGQEAPHSEDAECMFYSNQFSGDTGRETWIKCFMCELWAHSDCAEAEFATWICDFCK